MRTVMIGLQRQGSTSFLTFQLRCCFVEKLCNVVRVRFILLTLLQLWSKATIGDSSYPWMTTSYSVVTFFPHVFRIQKCIFHLVVARPAHWSILILAPVEKVQTLMTTSDCLGCWRSNPVFQSSIIQERVNVNWGTAQNVPKRRLVVG